MNAFDLGFVVGAIAMGYLTAALFFFRFWRRTRDILFLYFTLAFAVLCIHQIAFLIVGRQATEPYVLRLIAFLMILAGIIHKNYRR